MKISITIVLFLMLHSGSLAQQTNCWDAHQRGDSSLTVKTLDNLIDHYIKMIGLKQKADTFDYIRMVKLHNSLFFNRNENNTSVCWPEHDERYKKFNQLSSGRYFFDQLARYLGICIPNKGMGCYYASHNLDYGGGGPNEHSLYKIIP